MNLNNPNQIGTITKDDLKNSSQNHHIDEHDDKNGNLLILLMKQLSSDKND